MPRTATIAVWLMLPLVLPLSGGCVAKAVIGVATLPIKVASKTVDLATTSQSEADRNRGRDLRLREERLGRLDRDYRKHAARCARGDRAACASAEAELAEIDRLGGNAPP
jgi:hypothetical protein